MRAMRELSRRELLRAGSSVGARVMQISGAGMKAGIGNMTAREGSNAPGVWHGAAVDRLGRGLGEEVFSGRRWKGNSNAASGVNAGARWVELAVGCFGCAAGGGGLGGWRGEASRHESSRHRVVFEPRGVDCRGWVAGAGRVMRRMVVAARRRSVRSGDSVWMRSSVRSAASVRARSWAARNCKSVAAMGGEFSQSSSTVIGSPVSWARAMMFSPRTRKRVRRSGVAVGTRSVYGF